MTIASSEVRAISELGLGLMIGIAVVAFVSEYVDATLGMGYGTALIPVLLLAGFEPLQIIPAALLSQFVAGAAAALFHHRLGNVDFSREQKYIKIALILAVGGIIAVVVAVLIAVNLSETVIKIYIGVTILVVGILILFTAKRQYRFSWGKVFGIGFIAALNKGISGGGYGTVITGGQMLAGIEEKNAIGVTALAEVPICIVAATAYFIIYGQSSWVLAPYLVVGAVLSTPFSAVTVKRIRKKNLRVLIGAATIVLGLITLTKVIV